MLNKVLIGILIVTAVGVVVVGLLDSEWIEHNLVPIIIPLLLVMDVVILRLSRSEHNERLEHIKEIRANTEQITRRDYELVILHGIQTAEERIYCYWHSLHPVGQSETYKKINEELIAKKGEDVDVRIVIAADPSRIAAAYELVGKGVDVEFKESLNVSDLRFSIFDRQTTVFGVPESQINDNKPSRFGVDVSSRKLNALHAKYFNEEVAEPEPAVCFNEFVASHCGKVLKDGTSSVEMIAEQLGIPEEVIEEACPDEAERGKGLRGVFSRKSKGRGWFRWPW